MSLRFEYADQIDGAEKDAVSRAPQSLRISKCACGDVMLPDLAHGVDKCETCGRERQRVGPLFMRGQG